MNRAILGGTISSYGVRLSYTESSKPQLSFTLVLREAGRDGSAYHTYVPVQIVGPQAEVLAETLEAGDFCLVEGKLSWKAGKTKDAGKLQVVAFGVERLSESTQVERSEISETPESSETPAPKVRRPRLPKHLQRPWQGSQN